MPRPSIADYWEKSGLTGLVSRAILRTLQCIFAIVAAALYGLDLQQATRDGIKPDSSWIYAEFAAGTSMIVCIVHLFFTTEKRRWVVLDAIVFIFWVAQFGVFASAYLDSGNPVENEGFRPSRNRMRAAVWIDMINMLLWLSTTVQGVLRCCGRRKKKVQQEDVIGMNTVGERY
ncbi:hypothetical protein ACJ41O_001894 [Fusarium nematophilum]